MDAATQKQLDEEYGPDPAAVVPAADGAPASLDDYGPDPEAKGIGGKVVDAWKTVAGTTLKAPFVLPSLAKDAANEYLTGQSELEAARGRKDEAESAALEATAQRYEDAGDTRRAANIRLGAKAAQTGLAAKEQNVAAARNALLAVPEVPLIAAAPAAMAGLAAAGAVKGGLQGLGEEDTAGGVAQRALEGGLAASPTASAFTTAATGHEPRAGSLAKAAGIKDPVYGLLADLATDLIGAGATEQAYKVLTSPSTLTAVDVARLRAEYDSVLKPLPGETGGAFDTLIEQKNAARAEIPPPIPRQEPPPIPRRTETLPKMEPPADVPHETTTLPAAPVEHPTQTLPSPGIVTPEEIAQDALIAQRASDILASEAGVHSPTAIIKNVKEMGPREILPAARKIADFTKETLLGVVKALAPSALVKSKFLDILYQAKSGIASKVYDFDVAVKEAGKFFDHMPTQRSIDFIDNIKMGRWGNMSAEELQYARMYRALGDNNFEMLKNLPDAKGYLENHLRVRYKPGKALDQFIERELSNLKGPETFKHEQVFKTLELAMAAGLEPVTTNPFRLLVMERADIAKSALIQASWPEMQKAGGMMELTAKTQIPDTFKVLTREEARALGLPEIKPKLAPGEKITDALEARGVPMLNDAPGGAKFAEDAAKKERALWHAHHDVTGYAVEENVLRLYKNWASKDWIRSVSAGRGLVAIKNAYTMAELSFNLFHMMFVTSDVVSAEAGMMLRKAVNLPMRESLSSPKNPNSILNVKTPRGVYKEGRSIEEALQGQALRHSFTAQQMEDYGNLIVGDKWKKWSPAERTAYLDKMGQHGLSPEAMRQANLLFESGLEPHGQGLGFQMNSMANLNKAMADNKRLTAMIHLPPAVMQEVMSPLFNVYIPRLKLGLAQRELALSLAENGERIAKGMITEKEIARSVVSFVEDRLGELSYSNLWWNKTLKTALQTVFRSVTWNLGDIRAMPGGVAEQFKEAHLFLNDSSRGMLLTPKASWITTMVAQTMAMGTATQLIMTGIWPESLKDYFYPRTDPNDPTQRAGMMTYAKEAIHAVSNPGKFVAGKLAGVWGKAYESLYSNKTFYGNAISSQDDNWLMGAVKRFVHMLPVPISVSSGIRSQELGEPSSHMLMGVLGLPKASADVSQTPMQRAIAEYSFGQHPTAPREPEVAGKVKEMVRLRRILNADPEEGKTQIAIALEEGKLDRHAAQSLFDSKHHDVWTYQFGKMPLDMALRAIEQGSDEEKAQYAPLIKRKYQNQVKINALTPEKSQEYRERILNILNENQ